MILLQASISVEKDIYKIVLDLYISGVEILQYHIASAGAILVNID